MPLSTILAKAPVIRLRDPLADLLGAAAGGAFDYTYADAVRLAGHSCPTVAGAWLMLAAGLARLYPGETPVRGAIAVQMRDSLGQGTTGVVASIATLVTGAAGEAGFGGIGAGRLHARRGLLRFDAPIDGVMGLRRVDTGAGVVLDIDLSLAPPDPAMPALMAQATAAGADTAVRERFGALWQDRVRRLMAMAGDPRLVRIRDWA